MSFKGKLVKYFDGELDSVSVAHSITSLNFVTQKSQREKKSKCMPQAEEGVVSVFKYFLI